MNVNQSSSLGPRCRLCAKEQLEACLAKLSFSERAKDSIRQLFASGEVNPIIESYLQNNCPLIDNPFKNESLGLQSRLAQQAEQTTTEQSPIEHQEQVTDTPSPLDETPSPHMADVKIDPAPQYVTPPTMHTGDTDELAEISTNPPHQDTHMLTVLDTQHRIRLPDYGEFILGSWDALGSPFPDINLLYDDRGQHSVSARHARIFIKNKVCAATFLSGYCISSKWCIYGDSFVKEAFSLLIDPKVGLPL